MTEPRTVGPGQTEISEYQALTLILRQLADLKATVDTIAQAVLTQDQVDALTAQLKASNDQLQAALNPTKEEPT
jgi:chorismate-pyruvate lyase